MSESIAIIGLGKMGSTLVRGLKASERSADLWGAARTPQSAAAAEAELGIPVSAGLDDRLRDTSVVLVCVRPSEVCAIYEALGTSETLPLDTPIVSTAAGVSIAALERAFGKRPNPVIRAMPNTLCRIRRGMTVLCPGTHADARSMAVASSLFSAIGRCIELDEKRIDAATALSASSPAFVFLLIEAFVQAGVQAGLPAKTALELITGSFAGSVAMLGETGQHPAVLRDEITTPGGCTIAGIAMMERHGVRSAIARTVIETAAVARQLGQPEEADAR